MKYKSLSCTIIILIIRSGFYVRKPKSTISLPYEIQITYESNFNDANVNVPQPLQLTMPTGLYEFPAFSTDFACGNYLRRKQIV